MDLRDELEQAIGHGPALPAPEERLVAGRAALRRRRTLVAGAAAVAVMAVVVPVSALAGDPGSAPRDLGPVATPSSAEPSEPGPTPQQTAPASEDPDRGLQVVVVDGVPQLESEFSSVIIGPVVRDSEPYLGPRAYGLQVRLEGERSFVLLLQSEDGGWRVYRLVTAEAGEDLATWLRDAGWLPTGEEVSY